MSLFQTEFLCSLLDLNPGSEASKQNTSPKCAVSLNHCLLFAVCLGKQ